MQLNLKYIASFLVMAFLSGEMNAQVIPTPYPNYIFTRVIMKKGTKTNTYFGNSVNILLCSLI
jgi:hypothetical protein